MIWETWWIWVVSALALGILEMFSPGFILLGFALGALFVGLGLGFGLLNGLSFPILFVLFALISLGAWIILRRVFKGPSAMPKTFDYDVND